MSPSISTSVFDITTISNSKRGTFATFFCKRTTSPAQHGLYTQSPDRTIRHFQLLQQSTSAHSTTLNCDDMASRQCIRVRDGVFVCQHSASWLAPVTAQCRIAPAYRLESTQLFQTPLEFGHVCDDPTAPGCLEGGVRTTERPPLVPPSNKCVFRVVLSRLCGLLLRGTAHFGTLARLSLGLDFSAVH